jgi:hypothetical protein
LDSCNDGDDGDDNDDDDDIINNNNNNNNRFIKEMYIRMESNFFSHLIPVMNSEGPGKTSNLLTA